MHCILSKKDLFICCVRIVGTRIGDRTRIVCRRIAPDFQEGQKLVQRMVGLKALEKLRSKEWHWSLHSNSNVYLF